MLNVDGIYTSKICKTAQLEAEQERHARELAERREQAKEVAESKGDIGTLISLGPLWDAIEKLLIEKATPIAIDEGRTLYNSIIATMERSSIIEFHNCKSANIGYASFSGFSLYRDPDFIFSQEARLNGKSYTNMCYHKGIFYQLRELQE
jgi:hypothetical protein